MNAAPAPMDNASTPKPLSPLQSQRVLLPDHQSTHTKALLFCKRIDRVEVRGTTKLNGHTHFTVQLFNKKPQSNIPTLQRQQRAKASRSATPDATLYHRFSDFVNLRHEAYFHASNGHTKTSPCSYCASMAQLLYDGPTAPRLHMKLFHGNASIGMALEGFLNSLLQVTCSFATTHSTRVCEGQREIPQLLQKFLSVPDDKQQAEPADPTLGDLRKDNFWVI